MTVASDPPARRARTVRARLAAFGAALALIVSAAIAAPAAAVAASAPTPTPTPSPTAEPGVAVFTLSPTGNGLLNPGDALALSMTLQNGTDAAIGGGGVSVRFGDEPLASRAALGTWLSGDTTGVDTVEIATGTLDPVEPFADMTNGLSIPGDDPALAGLASGVYPLVATLVTSDQTFVSTSAVIVPDATRPTIGLGVVVPITAPATAEGLLTAEQLTELTGSAGDLTTQLNAVDGTEAILAVDPAIAAAIRVLGTSAPASAVAWLARLDGLTNSRFALQFGDADVAPQLQAGIMPPLEPTSLQAYMSPSDFVPEVAPTPAPTPSPSASVDPSTPVYPDLASLLAIGSARAGVFWPPTGTASRNVVQKLGTTSVNGQQGLSLIPSATTTAGAGGSTMPARGEDDGAGVLVYDSAISAELLEASQQGESPIRGASLTAATAYLAFAVAETGGAPLLVTIDRADGRSRIGMRTAITTALGAPSVRPSSLGGIANTTPNAVEVAQLPDDEPRVAAASALSSDEVALGQFATVLSDPSLITGPERAEVLQLLGAGWIPSPDAWTEALTAHRVATVTTLDAVGIVPPSPIQLISSGAGIPVWVRNDLPYPVTVNLLAVPDDLRLEVQGLTVVTAQPHSNTRAEVPVRAQIGNGEVTIDFRLESTSGVPIGQPQSAVIHVRADWEGIGIVILAVLAAGLVLFGLLRMVRRRRAARVAAAESESVTEPGPATEAGPEPEPEPEVKA